MDNKNNSDLNQEHPSLSTNLSNAVVKSQETLNAIKQEGERYVDQAKEQWSELKDQAQDKGQEIQKQMTEACRSADRYAHQNPWHIAGVAAVLGALAAVVLTNTCRRRD